MGVNTYRVSIGVWAVEADINLDLIMSKQPYTLRTLAVHRGIWCHFSTLDALNACQANVPLNVPACSYLR